MSCRKGAIAAIALTMIAVIVLAPVPSDASVAHNVECDGVTMVVFADSIEMNTTEDYPISIHLSNGNASPVTVKLTDDDNSVIDLSIGSEQVMLDGEETVELSAYLVTDRYTTMGDYTITFVMSVMDGISDVQTTNLTVDVKVTSNYSSGSMFNRIFGVFDNSLPEPFNIAPYAALVTFCLWVVIAGVAAAIVLLILKSVFKVIEKDSTTIGRGTAIGVFFCIMLAGTINCFYIAGFPEMVIEQSRVLSEVLYIIFAAIIIWDFYKAFVTTTLQKMEKRDMGMDTSLVPLFKAIGKIIIIIMCIALILSSFGVNFVTLITSVGLAGLGLSFGVKPAINELFSGLVVLTTRPFKVGDYVTVGTDSRLKVDEIGIIRTKFITGFTPEVATMPNSKIAGSTIVNISHHTVKYRNTVSVKVPFNSNLTLVKKIVKRVATEHPNIVTDGSVPKPSAVFSSCNDGSAVIVTLAFYVRDYDVNMSTCCQIREGILREFKERGIVIPLNKMEVTVFKGGQTDA